VAGIRCIIPTDPPWLRASQQLIASRGNDEHGDRPPFELFAELLVDAGPGVADGLRRDAPFVALVAEEEGAHEGHFHPMRAHGGRRGTPGTRTPLSGLTGFPGLAHNRPRNQENARACRALPILRGRWRRGEPLLRELRLPSRRSPAFPDADPLTGPPGFDAGSTPVAHPLRRGRQVPSRRSPRRPLPNREPPGTGRYGGGLPGR
jgi:hypothetical protein